MAAVLGIQIASFVDKNIIKANKRAKLKYMCRSSHFESSLIKAIQPKGETGISKANINL